MDSFAPMISTLLEALKLSPDNIPLRKQIAALLLDVGRTGEAIAHLEAVPPTSADNGVRELLGRAYYDVGNLAKATETLRDALQRGPTAAMHLLLAKSLAAQGEHQGAADHYQEATAMDPALEDREFWQELSQKLGKGGTKLRVLDFERGRQGNVDVEQPSFTFQNVGGLEELKEEIRMNIVYPFQNPTLFKTYGRKVGGGILLYGPPGCGKTFIARATAGECKARFVTLSINEILDMWLGNSEKNLHGLFETAREYAPCIIFIDELDAIGGSRQQMASHSSRSLTNQLLSEMDGASSSNENVLVLAATNAPWHVDSALRRPGRFDRVIFVPPPDQKARVEIFHLHLQNRPVGSIDFVKLAEATERYSGADIGAVCTAAADAALRDAMRSGEIRRIQTGDLLRAIKQVKPSTTEWLATARNYATYSNESGLYNDILDYLR